LIKMTVTRFDVSLATVAKLVLCRPRVAKPVPDSTRCYSDKDDAKTGDYDLWRLDIVVVGDDNLWK